MSEPEEEQSEMAAEESEIEPTPEEPTSETSETATVEESEEETVETAPAAEEKEEEAEAPEEEIEVVEEKTYTIPLRHVWVVTPRGKRAPRAVRDVRDFVTRHMKAEDVAISNEMTPAICSLSINKPPRKITVRAVKDKEGKVIVYPAKTT